MSTRFTTHTLLAAVALAPCLAARGQITQIQSDWLGAADGQWNNPANWSSPDFPDNAGFTFYDALIDAAGSPYTVSISNFNIDLDSLTLDSADATLRLFGTATLDANTIDLRNGTLFFENGRIEDATITATNGRIEGGYREGVFLEDVTLASDLEIDVTFLYLTNGVSLANDAVIDIQRVPGSWPRSITLEGTDPEIDGNGTIRFQDDYTMWVDAGNRAFINADITLLGQGGGIAFGSSNPSITSGRWINRGTIRVMGNGADLFISDGAQLFRNLGLIEGFGDAYLQFQGNWENLGTIRVHDTAIIDLDGSFDLAGIGALEVFDDAAVYLSGVLAMQPGEVFEVDGSIPTLEVHGATFQGGRIRGVDGNRFDDMTTVVLDGTTVESIELTSSNYRVRNGLVLDNADLLVENRFAGLDAFTFEGDQTISGTGRLVAATGSDFVLLNGHIVFGSGITIDATQGNAAIGQGVGSWENQGTVLVGPGSSARFRGVWTNNGTVVFDGGGTVELDDEFTTADIGTFTATGDATVRMLNGSEWDNTGQTADLTALFGGIGINLEQGQVIGGVFTATQPVDLHPIGIMRDLTIDLDWDMRPYPNRSLQVRGSLTVTDGHTITLGNGLDLRWTFGGPYALNGDGTIEIITNGSASELGGDGLVIASGVTVRNGDDLGNGGNLEINFQTNHGTLIQQGANDRLILEDTDATNLGTIRVIRGSAESTGLINKGLAEAVGVGALLDFSDTTNDGILRAVDGGVAELDGLTNAGQVVAQNGGVVRLGPTWANPTGTIDITDGGVLELLNWSAVPGTVNVDQSTVRLAFDTNLTLLNALPVGAGSTIEATRTLDLAGGTLDLDALAPGFRLVEGTLRNGMVIGSTALNIVNPQLLSISTLDGVDVHSDTDLGAVGTTRLLNDTTFQGAAVLGDGALLTPTGHTSRFDAAAIQSTAFVDAGAVMVVTNGLTLDGTIASGVGVGAQPRVRFDGTQAVTGSGAFDASTAHGLNLAFVGDLTLGEEITARALTGTLSFDGQDGTLTHFGSLEVAVARAVTANIGAFINHGEITANSGSVFQLSADTITNHGTIDLRNAMVRAEGTDIHNTVGSAVIGRGTVDVGGNATLHIAGTVRSTTASNSRLFTIGHLTLEDTAQAELTAADGRSPALAFLQATGDIVVDGSLTIDGESLTTVEQGQTLLLAQGSTLAGTFDQVNGTQAGPGLYWHLVYGTDRLVAEARLAGDATGDGLVGIEDLDLILANWDTTTIAGNTEAGDWTGDGLINNNDLQVVLNNWGRSTDPPDTDIPEPGTLALLAGSLLATRRRRRL